MYYRTTRLAGGRIAPTCAAALIAFAAITCTTSFAWASDSPDSQSQQIQQEQQYIGTAEQSFTIDAQTQTSGVPTMWTTASSHTDALASSFQIGSAFATNTDVTLETLSQGGEGGATQEQFLVPLSEAAGQTACTTDDASVLTATSVETLGTNRTNVTVTGEVCYNDAHELLDKVNAARAAVGAAPLSWDSTLERTAMQRAAEITIEWSHTRPNGEECFTAFTNIQKTAGENIAMGQANSTVVNNSWTNSEGHYKNMIATKYNSMAAACFVTDNGMHYWVEVFNGGDGDGQYYAYGEQYASFTVETLTDGPTYNTASSQTYNLNVGRSAAMNYAPDGESAAAASTLTFESSNPGVASVNAQGIITAIAPGSATIKVTDNLTGNVLFNTTATVNQNYMFNDVSISDWFATDDILGYAVSNNLLSGYSDSQFGPYDSITRGQVATILWRMAGSPSASAAKFSDVDYSEYYGSAINWARTTGVISGYDTANGTKVFLPDQTITREEFCVMLQRFAQNVAGVNTSVNSKMRSAMANFSDSSSVSSWATEAVEWAIGNGLISGDTTSGKAKINAKGTTYRCAAAKMVALLDQNIL